MAATIPKTLVKIAAFVIAIFVLASMSLAQQFPSGVIVLKNGQVFAGVIGEVPGGYGVQMNGAFHVVPAPQIDVVAASLQDAYRVKRARVPNPTVEDHMILARWCLMHGLLEEAQSEVARARILDPLREDSREMLSNVDQQIADRSKKPSKPKIIQTGDGFVELDERSTAGLFRETHQGFIRKVQPLLLNKCGNAHCHGEASPTEFKLTTIRSRGTAGNRLQNHANLLTVIDQIDYDNPQASPLLNAPTGLDAKHPAVLAGSNNKLLISLRQWVFEVVQSGEIDRKKLAAQADPVANQPRFLLFGPQAQQANHEAVVSDEEPRLLPQPLQASEIGSQREVEQTSATKKSMSADPFDPEIFNRRVHGAPARVLKDAKSSKSP
ncbi:hypothetical protein KOR42_00550 [Thalassoglobus neptunius]|uniref:Uncharacterized protein n=1 Tax=Thalassoglobus neptunius TaxID=1938619 RepID=A0A5C5X351_9PLAN|nr:hypothetical protein [Thalassoglobus neptunius]TWT56701.1 hypothetical protein KOR42_00550 [Thalassoglobus neptunius]